MKALLKQTKQRVKLAFKVLKGEITPIRKEADYNCEWYGNGYGGFYVHPDTISRESIVYSFGIGEDISFDNAIIEKHGAQVFAFDPTPKSINWIENQQLSPSFHFFGYGIDQKTGFINFNLPKNQDHVSGSVVKHQNVNEENSISVPMKSLADIIKELGHSHIDVLKMDIEGSEYAVIDSILAAPVRIDQILLELHERFFTDGKAKTAKLLKTLKEHGYVIYAVSDTFEEISFIKRT
jgi:FkbM family methyltransferase